jgi:hypothetical protein
LPKRRKCAVYGIKPINDQKDKDVKDKKPKKLEPVGTYPSRFDWRNKDGKDWMTPIREQGGCGSCWAFSALAIIEAKINIQANDPDVDIDLSEQHLVSSCCDGDCGSGWPGDGINYAIDVGIPTEECFPYTAQNSACTPCADWGTTRWNVDDYRYNTDESTYKYQISLYGPMSAIFAVYDDLHLYQGGIYQRTNTSVFCGYHAIAIVGWNDTDDTWIIKNSWGTDWGESGYGRIPREYFYANYGAYTIRNIVNYVPVAGASANPPSGTILLGVAFTGTGTDRDGTIVSYNWTFGDGASSTSQNPAHAYTSPGTYTATLTVTDDDGSTGTDSVEVVVVVADWNPWDDDCYISDAELSMACWHWSTATPKNGHTVSDADISLLVYQWCTGDVC